MEEEPTPAAESLSNLQKFLEQVVLVGVKDGRKFKGKLLQYDEHMNLVLENAEEMSKEGQSRKHRLLLLKGGNVSEMSI
jgi:small nuclear ribonucleoprotein